MNEINLPILPPHVTTRMNPEGITVSEISEMRKTSTAWYHLYVKAKKKVELKKWLSGVEAGKTERFVKGHQLSVIG